MHDQEGFADLETTLEKARSVYSEIYGWHKRTGKEKITERFSAREEDSGSYKRRYLDFLVELPRPRAAKAEDMLRVAHEVLSGVMEWSYSETENGIQLSDHARRIEDLLRFHAELLGRKTILERLEGFNNVDEDWRLTQGRQIEIPLQNNETWSAETYFHYAAKAYRDIPDTEMIGGRVFLAETNLELTHPNKTRYSFNNARLLHLEAIREENTLIHLVELGQLSVEAVTLES